MSANIASNTRVYKQTRLSLNEVIVCSEFADQHQMLGEMRSVVEQIVHQYKLCICLKRVRGRNYPGLFQRSFGLDHVFVQALCLEPLLFDKLRQWSGCQGLYQSVSNARGLHFRWFSQLNGGLYSGEFSRSRLKSAHRAIEKLIRAYGHDVSRLADVCRQTAVFADVAGISECLKLMSSDLETTIVRIKNRMDPDCDASLYGGYRDVNINLHITSQAAVALGVDSHVCEVQLVLIPIARLKSEGGHRNYIVCRNLRAD